MTAINRQRSALGISTAKDDQTGKAKRATKKAAGPNPSPDMADAVLSGRGGPVHNAFIKPFQHFTPGKDGKPGHFSLKGDDFADVVFTTQKGAIDNTCYYQTIAFHDKYQALTEAGLPKEAAIKEATAHANQKDVVLATIRQYTNEALTPQIRQAIEQSLLTGSIEDYGGTIQTGQKADLVPGADISQRLKKTPEGHPFTQKAALVLINMDGKRSHGSGCLIRPDVILTCRHNMTDGIHENESGQVAINGQHHRVNHVEIYDGDGDPREHDLALLFLEAPIEEADVLELGAINPEGEQTVLFGHPNLCSAVKGVQEIAGFDGKLEELNDTIEALDIPFEEMNTHDRFESIIEQVTTEFERLDNPPGIGRDVLLALRQYRFPDDGVLTLSQIIDQLNSALSPDTEKIRLVDNTLDVIAEDGIELQYIQGMTLTYDGQAYTIGEIADVDGQKQVTLTPQPDGDAILLRTDDDYQNLTLAGEAVELDAISVRTAVNFTNGAQHIASYIRENLDRLRNALVDGAYGSISRRIEDSGQNVKLLFHSGQAVDALRNITDHTFEHTMDCVDGNSGSPIMQGDRVVGVHVRGEAGRNTAIKLEGQNLAWINRHLNPPAAEV